MTRTNIEYTFSLENGSMRVVTVKDVREDIEPNEITALSSLLIEKNSQFNGIAFESLKKCVKYTVEEEIIV